MSEIVTFYSYKGGTGRSMALANVAWILAGAGKHVLAIDWDLEAPGLHRYFHPFLVDPQLRGTNGLINLFWDYTNAVMQPGEDDGAAIFARFTDVTPYTVPVRFEFPRGGQLSLLPAGRQDSTYSQRIALYDWDDFYARHGGAPFLGALRRRLLADYDYVLIDSRTGMADTAGICTVALPDTLVNCMTLNGQSIDGAVGVAESVRALRRDRPIRLLPALMRVEDAEQARADARRDYVRRRFAPTLDLTGFDGPDSYWAAVEVPYKPLYAYEETLAAVRDRPKLSDTLLAALERLTGVITNGEVTRAEPIAEPERQRLVAAFEHGPAVPRDLIILCVETDRRWAEWLHWVLGSEGWPATVEPYAPEELTELLAGTALLLPVAGGIDAEPLRNSPGWLSVLPVVPQGTAPGGRAAIGLDGLSDREAYERVVAVLEELRLPRTGTLSPAGERPAYPGMPIDAVTLELAAGRSTLLGPGDARLAEGTPDAGQTVHPDVRAELISLIDKAWRNGTALTVAIDTQDAQLSVRGWEQLASLPQPVPSYCRVAPGSTPPPPAPGPLRILLVMADPDPVPVLDLTAWAGAMLDMTGPRHRRPDVRLLHRGTRAAIADALIQEPVDVLHFVCGATGAGLLLETEDGQPEPLGPDDLAALCAVDRPPRLVVLDAAPAAGPALARALVGAGVAHVLNLNGVVAARDAETFAHEYYGRLAAGHDAAAALWLAFGGVSPTLYQSQAAPALVDVRAEPRAVAAEPTPVADGLPERPVAAFVGRRADLRRLEKMLRHEERPGAYLLGEPGVGKSVLAAELIRRLGADANVVAGAGGTSTVDDVLNAAGRALLAYAVGTVDGDVRAHGKVAAFARDAANPWTDRLEVLRRAAVRILLVVDGYEDGDPELRELLRGWRGGGLRLLVTGRRLADLGLRVHVVGSLPWAESRLLMTRLPSLAGLGIDEQLRVHVRVDGHPRALEYLDALLRRGPARFPDVQRRLEAAGHPGPATMALEGALTEAVRLARE